MFDDCDHIPIICILFICMYDKSRGSEGKTKKGERLRKGGRENGIDVDLCLHLADRLSLILGGSVENIEEPDFIVHKHGGIHLSPE